MNSKLAKWGLFAIVNFSALLYCWSISTAEVVFVSGDVYGVWDADTVVVTDSCRVPPDQTLTIEPGVHVMFIGYWGYTFLIDNNATLLAVGTETDSIKFLPFTEGNYHQGLTFLSSSSNSILEYCHIRRSISSGVYCDDVDLTIRNCLIDSCETNYGRIEGGGITLINGSEALIEYNAFRDNYAHDAGGAIYIVDSSPTVAMNLIEDNHAGLRDALGGGIYIYGDSNPSVEKNIIRGNAVHPSSLFSDAVGLGGGIFIGTYCAPHILNNMIFDNYGTTGPSALPFGGGIYSATYYEECIISGNLIIGNYLEEGLVEESNGGGIYLGWSDATVENNTIAYNSAPGGYGGGIYVDEWANPAINNSIIYFNSAGLGPQIYEEESGDAFVTYCDVEGGWNGTGNISEDPLFVDPENGYYELQYASPCIDAGDPNINDPDGTVSDIGALFFHQGELIVSMVPDGAPISVPAGERFAYEGYLKNNSNQMRLADLWIELILPDGSLYGPIKRYNNVPIESQEEIIIPVVYQNVPVYAPLGLYGYRAYCGDYPDMKVDSAEFGFYVTSPAPAGSKSWEVDGWFRNSEFTDEDENLTATQVSYGSYPNPFNARINIEFDLIRDADVQLKIYNVGGQLVNDLVDRYMESGKHVITWDAADTPSGIYFYKLSIGNDTYAQRITLVK
ncbi:MAG: T9SS type A sorting domain-containing protein [candidate division Zixibacteria bacterium]|nr:T9SS type A sorting domain-containing protein [candidate division Zixibacteria bacterium]